MLQEQAPLGWTNTVYAKFAAGEGTFASAPRFPSGEPRSPVLAATDFFAVLRFTESTLSSDSAIPFAASPLRLNSLACCGLFRTDSYIRYRAHLIKITISGKGIHRREISGIGKLRELPGYWYCFTNLELIEPGSMPRQPSLRPVRVPCCVQRANRLTPPEPARMAMTEAHPGSE
jgi:hypothetical protein